MTRDHDAFVFYAAVAIAVASLFIGYETVPEAAAPVAQEDVRPGPDARPVSAPAEQRALVVAVSHKIR
jgi:hypothetical protein